MTSEKGKVTAHKGDTMARGELVNSIQDLQFEWASNFSSRSVRDFLINIKRYSPRQYRYLMFKAPHLEWKTKRQEVQNNVLSAKHDALIRDALETNNQIFNTAKLGVALVVKAIADKNEIGRLTSKELLEYMRTIETTQTIAIRAFGMSPEINTKSSASPGVGQVSKDSDTSTSKVDEMSYEDVMILIDVKREMRRRTVTAS